MIIELIGIKNIDLATLLLLKQEVTSRQTVNLDPYWLEVDDQIQHELNSRLKKMFPEESMKLLREQRIKNYEN